MKGQNADKVCFDEDLIRRYDGRGPRYTSYPTALQFDAAFTADDYREAALASNESGLPLSLYVHVPFCHSLCYYCGCNKIVTRNQTRVNRYLDNLHAEIDMQAQLFANERMVEQLHFGGGTPTYLNELQLDALMKKLRSAFSFDESDTHEFSIEVDPRTVSRRSIAALSDLGFNRLSLGVQDFDEDVQKAVNRIQTAAEVQSLVALAVYNYAHLPERFKGQRMIDAADLPLPQTKLDVLHHTIDKLDAAGYVYIGMDHFALPDDDLVKARHAHTLQRNFQGYSTHRACDLIGLGVSSIGNIGRTYAQSAVTTMEYEALIEKGRLPIARGVALDDDDVLRAAAIQQLMCYDEIIFVDFDKCHATEFTDYFAAELDRLSPLAADGLVTIDDVGVHVTAKGRLLLRNIAMVFDRYISSEPHGERYSKAI
jgi:oxygen-independent coproporphyrinogen-3 oxidase